MRAGRQVPLSALDAALQFGWALGCAFADLTGSHARAQRAGERCALLNGFLALCDRICDDMPMLYPQLSRIVTGRAITAACVGDAPAAAQAFAHPYDTDPTVKLASTMLASWLEQCRTDSRLATDGAECATAGGRWLMERIADTATRAWAAESASRRLGFDRNPHDDATLDNLLAKSQLPAWLLFLSACAGPHPDTDALQAAEAPILALGEAIGLLDDLVDCEEDLRAGSWSLVWIAHARQAGLPDFRDPAVALRTLAAGKCVDALAHRLLIKADAGIAGLSALYGDASGVRDVFAKWYRRWLDVRPPVDPKPGRPLPRCARAQEAVESGLGFIVAGQWPSGEFPTRFAPTPDLDEAGWVSSIYLTTYVAESLGARGGAATAITQAVGGCADFVARHVEPDGIWRFFADSQRWPPPDADDTACALALLQRAGRPIVSSFFSQLDRWRAQSGACLTWLDDEMNEAGAYHADGVVNANVLLAAARHGLTLPSIVGWLARYARIGKLDRLSVYSDSPCVVAWLITRAAREDTSGRLREILPWVGASLRRSLRRSDDADELDVAMELMTLLRTGNPDDRTDALAERLLATQRGDGSWAARAFFQDFTPRYYGSEELTTALCVEALGEWVDHEEVAE